MAAAKRNLLFIDAESNILHIFVSLHFCARTYVVAVLLPFAKVISNELHMLCYSPSIYEASILIAVFCTERLLQLMTSYGSSAPASKSKATKIDGDFLSTSNSKPYSEDGTLGCVLFISSLLRIKQHK